MSEFTTDQNQQLAFTRAELDRTGAPELIARMDVMEANGASFKELMKVANRTVESQVKPETDNEAVAPPPFTGAGATNKAWRKFAAEMSDMDPEVIESLGREDLVVVLADKGIISLPE